MALAAHLWGVRGDLPWAYGSDEGQFAVLAIRMATEGDPNPQWFGHPGSTFLYPLAALFHVGNALEAGKPLLRHDPGLAARVGGNPGKYFLLGRLVSVAYAVLALPLLFLIARIAYDETTAAIATWMALLSPISLSHAQMLRTDSAGLFFGLLALRLSLRVLERPTRAAHLLAGLGIGVAIGTRYFLVTLVPVLLAADVVLLRRAGGPLERRRIVTGAGIALACVALGFALSTPYFFADLGAVVANLAHESRSEHLGADGLGFAGNLRWYLTSALPDSMPGPLLVLAGVGLAHAAWRRNVAALLAAGSVALFVVAISAASLHWQRWLIQVLPLLAMFAAAALVVAVRGLARRVGARPAVEAALLAVATVLVSAQPALAFFRFSAAQAVPSTRIEAREWIVENLPAGSTVAAEIYSAPLHDSPLEAGYHFSLAADGTVADYREAGYRYALVTSAIRRRYQSEPRRYARELAFYRDLATSAKLVKRFVPGRGGRGATIELYDLAP